MKRIPQTKLAPQPHKDLRWGSHVPLTKAILATFPITGALELGAGTNSTPVLFSSLPYVVSVEADKGWIEKLRSEKLITETDNHRIVHHEVPADINRSTIRENIDPSVLANATKLYRSVMRPEHNYLFVDCYAGFRLRALNDLHTSFDVITYHDAEPKDDKWYGYSTFQADNGYNHFVDRTFMANTGLIVTKKFQHFMDKFLENYAKEAALYADRFNAEYKPTIEKIR